MPAVSCLLPLLWNRRPGSAFLWSRHASVLPEDLDALLEDGFVLRDRDAVAALFEPGALATTTGHPRGIHGHKQIAALAVRLWSDGKTYVAQPGASFGLLTSPSSFLQAVPASCDKTLRARGAT